MTVKAGADINSASNEGLSPLQLAAKHGHLPVVQWLLKSGATVGAADKYGFTALHDAAENGQKAAVQALLEAGADAAAQTTEEVGGIEVGTTAAALAEKGGHSEIVEILQAN